MIKLLHFMHGESNASWNFVRLEETDEAYIGVWSVVCKCGAVKIRKRAYPKPDEVSKRLEKYYTRERDGDTFYTMCGFTYDAALKRAKLSKGDNYHV